MNEPAALSPASPDYLTRVGPGTPLGTLLREYWTPACLSSELVADGNPLRLLLLGEKLVAFRDTQGRVGVLDHRCPHRCASLFFGRNEQGGLRCVYHGWKYDVTGQCLEMPNVPKENDFSARLKARAYPSFERLGVVWVYLGSRALPPPQPEIEVTLMPPGEARVSVSQRECNWLQVIEGDLDTSHLGFLHLGSVSHDEVDPENLHAPVLADRAPYYEVKDTPWGVMGGARRQASTGLQYWRLSQFLFPFWALVPDGSFEDNLAANASVPMDDTHTLVFNFAWTRRTPPMRSRKDGSAFPGLQFKHEFLPNTSDWHGRWRSAANAQNDYLIDRDTQRNATFTGVDGITIQDQYITESMGPIVDRRLEHLAHSDLLIARARRRLRGAIEALLKSGTVPPGVDDPEVNLRARSGSFNAPDGQDIEAAYAAQFANTVSPVSQFLAAKDASTAGNASADSA
ncbi:MAG: Rieske 2Fe-2S domain-containing protein [Gammaproteobacteria bacterium]